MGFEPRRAAGRWRGARRAANLNGSVPLVWAAALILSACTETEVPLPEGEAAASAASMNAGTEVAAGGDWPNYNRDLAGTRFSPLTQINRANVAGLREAWSYELGRNVTTGGLSGGSEFTPIVVNGIMYVAAADRVVALEPESGAEIWRFELTEGAPSRRGVMFWSSADGAQERLFFTAGRSLIALEAGTGLKAAGFGVDGEIEMPVAYNAAPTRFDDLVIVGSNSAPGSVRAFDARTGKAVWEFLSVPGPGEPGHETWRNESWRAQPNLLHWAFAMTIDVEREILYTAFESPGPDDYYGGNRPGDNLFGNSVVALDIRTGERLWHYQTVHHDLWDYDLPAAPGLLDVTIDGEDVPVLVEAGKTGYLYILNRVTGEPVFGIEEQPVPASDVPGEQSAPTQPIPVAPPPIARVSYGPEDLVSADDTNEEHAAFCAALVERSGGMRNEGPFTPYRYRGADADGATTLVFPGSTGGANWGGTASDPNVGLVFVNTMDEGSIGWIESAPSEAGGETANGADAGEPLRFRRMSVVGGPLARFWSNDSAPDSGGNELRGSERAWPCQKPPWGRLVAVDAATGAIVWQVPLGITEDLPEGKRKTGRLNMGGPIATAGGLVFIAATNDRRFRAFDSLTGAELWVTELPLSGHAVPITYRGSDGRQYVAITAAGAAAIDDPDAPDAQTLIAYALP